MAHYPRRSLVEAYELVDLLIMVGSFFTVVWLVAFRNRGLSLVTLLEERLKVSNVLLFFVLVMIWHLILKAFGVYRSASRASRWAEAFEVFKATSLGSLVIVSLAIIFDIGLVSHGRWFAVAFWATSTTATIGCRALLRFALRQVRGLGGNLRALLIVGTNARARRLAERIGVRPELGCRVIGFVDEGWPGLEEFHAQGGRLVADLDGLPEYLRRNVVDEVVLALPIGSFYPKVEGIVHICEEQGITARFLADIFNGSSTRAMAEMFQDHPIVTIQAVEKGGWLGASEADP